MGYHDYEPGVPEPQGTSTDDCPTCDGRGVTAPADIPDPSTMSDMQWDYYDRTGDVPCPDCQGTGTNWQEAQGG